jgi:DNA-binding beta-propeller fold protein YncE
MAIESRVNEVVVGSGEYRYRAVPNWERLPAGWTFVEAVGVATDSQDRVFVFNRGQHPVIVFDRDGNFLQAWGEGQFVRPHGIWIGLDDTLYLTDDQDHTVRRFTPDGELLQTLGTSGQPSDTGIEGIDYRTIKQAASPFNLPTNLALAADGSMYVSDGYGNSRVHRFAPDGELLLSWGEPGSEPGQFNLPHGIGVDGEGRVFVADRENSRIQIFSPDGEFIDEWTDVVRPCEVFIDRNEAVYVAELGRRAGMFPWMTPDSAASGGRVSIFDRNGNLLARFGGGDQPSSPHDFFAPHDIWVDSAGSIYVGEVTWSAGGNRGLVPRDCPSLKKFVRVLD